MSARRLEEIFEECVTAYLEGRRSVQESLRLYPAYASELAPLLRTAVQLNESFSTVEAPAHVQARVHQRFLADARARRQVRKLARIEPHGGFLNGLWRQHRLGFAGAAAAVGVLAVAVTSATLLGGGTAGEPGAVGNLSGTAVASQKATPASVTHITTKAQTLGNQAATGGTVKPEDIDDLVSSANELSALPTEDVQNSKAEVEQALRQADDALSQVAASQPALAQQAQAAKDTLRDVAGGLGIDLNATPAPTEAVTATPVGTGETPQPTQVVTPAPTPVTTPEPTPVATDSPVPTETPPERGLPGDAP
jgi:hypothetical protein